LNTGTQGASSIAVMKILRQASMRASCWSGFTMLSAAAACASSALLQ
jgi:hypothetical protein